MRKLLLILLCFSVFFTGCSQYGKPRYHIDLPKGYQIEKSEDNYNLLTASKYSNGEVVAMIEIRYSDDWSFSVMKNDEYISEMLKGDGIEAQATMMFDNFKIHSKEELYLKGAGDCFSLIYSGDHYTSGVRQTNFIVQFVKNDKLYTLLGSAFPDNFSSEHKTFLKSFDTFSLR
jgi:thioredoxin-related protein